MQSPNKCLSADSAKCSADKARRKSVYSACLLCASHSQALGIVLTLEQLVSSWGWRVSCESWSLGGGGLGREGGTRRGSKPRQLT